MGTKLCALCLIVVITPSCTTYNEPYTVETGPYPAKFAKWPNNHAAAISITYDHGSPLSELNKQIQQLVLSYGLTLDYEVVSSDYDQHPERVDYLVNTLVPQHFGYYGHGHIHVYQDNLPAEEVYDSMRKCYECMIRYGLKPVAYGYPASGGLRAETRKALAMAGFLSGRLHFSPWMTNPLLVPGDKVEPADWFALPTLVMQDYKATHSEEAVCDNRELVPYLDDALDRRGWLILTYHSIGEEPNYGFFDYNEFVKNLGSIKERDFWNASMNEVTLYLLEKKRASLVMEYTSAGEEIDEITITLIDGLANDLYDQPLTLLFTAPDTWIGKSVGRYDDGRLVELLAILSPDVMLSLRPDEVTYRLAPVRAR